MENNGTNCESMPIGLHIPVCDVALKPRIGLSFVSLDKAREFYRAYGAACGFTSRNGTLRRAKADPKTITLRHFVCSREGNRNSYVVEGPQQSGARRQKRRRPSCRVDCMARVALKFKAGVGYVIYSFTEGHTHHMVSEGYRHLMKVNRNINYGHQMFLAKCSKANIGCVRSFRTFKELVGGFEDVGCSLSDFKNLARDIKVYTKGVDAQMLLEKFERKRSMNSGFFFEYDVDEDTKLIRLFWADAVSVQNFQLFGEAVSLDATYSMNKYSMIFTPFTGRDNQGRCVTFGAGLISNEDSESYSWVLSNFVKCMGSHPKMIVTDQDLGLKLAIEKVLPDTRHRFCMWHIMRKVADKLPKPLSEDEDFKNKLYGIVWSECDEPIEFEEKWQNVMEEFQLVGHKWFEDMYNLRTYWIPAYFRDLPMSGLFRTTSLSESENSFFRRYLNKNANLCEMYMLFETALEAQRNEHDGFSLVDETCVPKMITKLPIEEDAASLYTNNVFLTVQKEIEVAVMFCTVQNVNEHDSVIMYEVDEDAVGIVKVTYNISEDFISCACKEFVKHGLVCKHMFAVMRYRKLTSIPEKYVIQRWTKKACSVFDAVGQNRFALGNDGRSRASKGLFGLACNCIGLVNGNEDLMNRLKDILTEFWDEHSKAEGASYASNGKQRLIEQYYGAPLPVSARVGDPDFVQTKGSCSRIKSRKEAAIERSKKAKRRCNKCKTLGYHDSRNCDKVAAAKKK